MYILYTKQLDYSFCLDKLRNIIINHLLCHYIATYKSRNIKELVDVLILHLFSKLNIIVETLK